jgi:methylthioribose-1-phosphate isomerase
MMIDLSPDAWGAVAAVGAAATTGVCAVLVELGRRSSKTAATQAEQARMQAAEAADLSRPTANGFATTVEDSLQRIEAGMARTDSLLDEITRQVHRIGNQLTTHLEDHVRGSA